MLYFYYLKMMIFIKNQNNQSNKNDHNKQTIIINIFHQNQTIMCIYQIAHHQITIQGTQMAHHLHQQKREQEEE